MGKNPAFQFYPSDWSRDLEEHPLEIEGAWIRICCKLWWSETRGKLERNLEQWAKILRVYPQDAERILNYINLYKIGDILNDPNGNITVISRRMIKDEKERENNCLRQKRHYEKKQSNAIITADSQDSSSSTSSSKQKNNTKKEKISFVENHFLNIPIALMEKWREVSPGIDINGEIKKAELWLLANPEKRRSRYESFLSKWMVKAQENFIKYGGNNAKGNNQGFKTYTGRQFNNNRELSPGAAEEADRINADYYAQKAAQGSSADVSNAK